MSPVRVQRRRVKGWRTPENTVYVGRPGKFGNPYDWKQFVSDNASVEQAKQMAVEKFEEFIYNSKAVELRKTVQRELKGKNLSCWCSLQSACHADVLLIIANS